MNLVIAVIQPTKLEVVREAFPPGGTDRRSELTL
jgi:nitrogen regulatory protein PII